MYSSNQLDKSRSSLANSRHSNKSVSSIQSKKSLSRISNGKKFGNSQNVRKNIKIVEKNIDNVQLNEVSNYLRIFCNHSERGKVKSPRNSYEKNGGNKIEKENSSKPSALEKIVEEYGTKHRQKALLPRLIN